MRRTWFTVALLTVASWGVLGGCKSSTRQDPLLSLSATESLTQGKSFLAKEKYTRARPFLLHAFEVEPNSLNGREALLLAADTFYLEGGKTNFLQAEAKYRDFLNRFPTSDRAAYAQFQVGSSLARRMERPDRDQSTARKALEAFEDLIRLYPTSEYAAQAREQVRLVRDNLAEHEFQVARFYLLVFKIPEATVQRLEHLFQSFPDYTAKDKAYLYLGRGYAQTGDFEKADKTFARLESQFPDSPQIKEVPAARKEMAAFQKLFARGKAQQQQQPQKPPKEEEVATP
ncbi:MAG TPA: outer membrane protein assembly factor BamD [Thermoanaerobaculia bacterium]|nr:outer membrane protein assembly factor BamD [Thermoanaerobaculia bacterium]